MSVRRVSPAEAAALIEQDGWLYLDVRSVPEFDAGHPEGAYNIPLLHMQGPSLVANGRFVAECQAVFPADTKLVVGCKSGGRSLQAASMLMAAGYASVVDQRAGFDGASEPGWRHAGLPVARQARPSRSYAEIAGHRA
jgi:rhodanese-related sulfurtransferase